MNFKAVLITAWIWFPALTTAYETDSGAFLVCDSPECTQRAKLINESLNTSIDPCTDFYSYVCDRWESNHPLTGGRNSYDVYDEVRKDIPETLSDILGNRTRVESNQTVIDKVATMYNACLALPDTPHALIRVLNESGYNAWPILSGQNVFNSSNCTDLLRHMSISAIMHVTIDKKNGYGRKPVCDYDVYLRPMQVQEKIQKMPDIAAVINNTMKLLNPGIDSSMLDGLTKQLVEFSNDMSEITIESRLHTTYNISSLEAKFPNIPITALLKKEFQKVNITFNDGDTFQVFYTYIDELIKIFDRTNPNTLYNYAGFLALFPYLEYVQMSYESEFTMSSTKGRNKRECITLLDKSARDVLDYLYVSSERNHTAIKNEVEDVARRIIQAFNETLQNVSWVDNKTRQAIEKELKAPLEIGYPDALLNMSVLEAFYEYVPYFPSNISFTEAFYYFQENLYKMKLRKFRHPEESNWRSIHSPREGRTKFNEKYGIDIEIPYPILVSPIFQRGLPRSLTYGGIGGIIARELGSTFSINGMQTMPRRHKGFPTNAFYRLIENNTSCFEQQYRAANNRMLREHHLDRQVPKHWPGTDQALADNTGLQMAFKAYSRVLKDECANVDTRLTGLENITGMQLFFISDARTQCRITHKDTLYNDIALRWPYTPARNRVNEAMKNLEGFAKAFNCSLGTPMHPKKTCFFL